MSAYLSEYVSRVCSAFGVQEKVLGPVEVELVTAMWMPGALPRSSVRAGSAPLSRLSSPCRANRLRVILHSDEKSYVSDPDGRRRSR